MAGIRFTAIIPARDALSGNIEGHVNAAIQRYLLAVQARMQAYPPAQPWRSRPPKTGLRAGGRRTGTYGKGWSISMGRAEGTLANNVRYAAYVGGPKDKRPGQTSTMRGRGWPSISDVAWDEIKKHHNVMSRAVLGE